MPRTSTHSCCPLCSAPLAPAQRPSAEQALRHPFLRGGAADRAAGKPLDQTVVQRIQVDECHRGGAGRPMTGAPAAAPHVTGRPHSASSAPTPDAFLLLRLRRSLNWLPLAAAHLLPPPPPAAPPALPYPAALCPELAVQAHGAGAHCARPAQHAFRGGAQRARRGGCVGGWAVVTPPLPRGGVRWVGEWIRHRARRTGTFLWSRLHSVMSMRTPVRALNFAVLTRALCRCLLPAPACYRLTLLLQCSRSGAYGEGRLCWLPSEAYGAGRPCWLRSAACEAAGCCAWAGAAAATAALRALGAAPGRQLTAAPKAVLRRWCAQAAYMAAPRRCLGRAAHTGGSRRWPVRAAGAQQQALLLLALLACLALGARRCCCRWPRPTRSAWPACLTSCSCSQVGLLPAACSLLLLLLQLPFFL